jgi:hypothetical protein
MEADAKMARPDGVVNGINVGPGVKPGAPSGCGGADYVSVMSAELHATDWGAAIPHPTYLPAGATLEREEGLACHGRLAAFIGAYRLPVDSSAIDKVASGQTSWFDVAHGGFVEIRRTAVVSPAAMAPFPRERMASATVAGHGAVVIAPVLKRGFGEGRVIVWGDGFLTEVIGMHLTSAELVAIAEGLFK